MRDLRCHGRAAALAVVAGFCVLDSGGIQAAKIDGDRLLAPDHLVEIRIELADEDWEVLRRQARNAGAFFSGAPMEDPYEYFEADIWIDGIEIESVGVRKKGFFGSVDSNRPSLKVKFDEFVDQDPMRGLSRLTLNNNKQDTSQVSQFLTYRLFREAGVHAPRCNFARVTVNGEYLGIYSNVESIKKPFLSRSFGDKTGNLYEGTLTDFHPATINNLEVKTNEEANDRSDVTRLAALLEESGEVDLEELDRVIDVENFITYWAMEGLIRFWDGYSSNQNNYYFYFHPDDGRAYFIPWGADGSFTRGGGPMAFFNQGSTAVYAQSLLANRLYHSEGVPARYRETMQRLLDETWDEEELVAAIDRVERLITPHLHEVQRAAPQAMSEVREFIRTRRGVIEVELSNWPASVPAEPRTPMYTVPIGRARGSFVGVWSNAQPGTESAPAGEVELQLELDGEVVELKDLGVSVRTFSFGPRGGFGQRRGSGGGGFGPPADFRPPLMVVLSGTRAGDGERLTLTLMIDRDEFEVAEAGETLDVAGNFTEGQRGGFGFGFGRGSNRSIRGRLELEKTGAAEGEEVAGSIEVEIVEVRGGFFGRQRPVAQNQPGGAEGNVPARAPSGQGAPAALTVPVMQALDADGDGRLSAAEIENATSALTEIDGDGDGELSQEELGWPPAGRFGGNSRGFGGAGQGRFGGGFGGGFGGQPGANRPQRPDLESSRGDASDQAGRPDG